MVGWTVALSELATRSRAFVRPVPAKGVGHEPLAVLTDRDAGMTSRIIPEIFSDRGVS